MGQTNVVDGDDLYKIIDETTTSIIDNLCVLCGKKALLDIIVFKEDANDYLNNVFSNDGIRILKRIEYVNPIQTYIANYIRYIAERVEKASSDGTSTAILFSAYLIGNIFDELKKFHDEYKEKTDVVLSLRMIRDNTHVIKDHTISALNSLRHEIKKYIINFDDVSRKDKEKLIYNLAYTTSKGNEFLAKTAVDLFIDIPPVLYKYVSYQRSQGETNEPLSVVDVDHDFSLKVLPSSNTVYNEKLGTELHYEKCNVIVIPYVNDTNANALISWIDERYVHSYDNKPLVVLVKGADDRTNVFLETSLGPRGITYCQAFSHLPTFVNNPLELHILQVVANKNIVNPITYEDFDKSLITDIECRLFNRELHFYGLYVSSSYIHPSYITRENSDYVKICSELEERINDLENYHDKVSVKSDLIEFVRLYISLVCHKLPKLIIGGSSFEHLSNIDVVEDVLGVVSVAMKEGVIIDLVPKVIEVIKQLDTTGNDVIYNIIDDFFSMYFQLTYDELFDSKGNVNKFSVFNKTNDDWSNESFDTSQHLVVQSAKSFDELLARLIETLPKLICVDRVIVKNGVMTKEE